MIEVRTFEEDAATAAAFTHRVWTQRYALKVPVIEWSPEYFHWELLWDRPGARDFTVAAYEGTKLVGFLFAERLEVHIAGKPAIATSGSWLSVDPEHRRDGVARKIADEQRKRHREHGAAFMLGFGLAHTDGPRFWEKLPDTKVACNLGFWMRPFDKKRVIEWSPAAKDRLLMTVASPILAGPVPEVDRAGVRPFEERDLAECTALLQALGKDAELGYRWSEARVRHQLAAGPISRTLVLEDGGKVLGLVNHYRIDMTARTTLPCAVIDFMAFAEGAPQRDRRRLINAALADMAREGAGLAMMLRIPCYPSRDLWATGFVPTPKESSVIFGLTDPSLPRLQDFDNFYIHWR